MTIKSVYIKNYRSIGPNGLTLKFESNLTALIGKNNVGKSTILEALNIVLGDKWPKDSMFKLEDFYQKNTENDIEICVYFAKPIEDTIKVENWYDHKIKIAGFKFEFKAYKKNTEQHLKGELHHDYSCIDTSGKVIRTPSKAPRKGKHKEFLSSFINILRVTKKYRNQIPLAFIPVDRDISKYAPHKYYSLLGTLIKQIRDTYKFEQEETTISKEVAEYLQIETKVNKIHLFESLINKANESLKTEELTNISSLIGKYLKELIGENSAQGVEFDFAIQNIWDQFKYLELSVSTNDLNLPADRLGSGFQSLVVISIFRTYCEIINKDSIFLIEEPEMSLDPHTKKYFYSVLQQIATKGTQIIYSTHSSEFVDITRYKDIKKIIKDSSNNTNVYPEDATEIIYSDDELFKLSNSVNNERGELLFSDFTLLVEGMTEKLVYEYLFQLKGLPTNLNNISIIETAGKGSIPKFIKLLESFDIPYGVVYDSDILEITGESEIDNKIKENNKDAAQKNDNILAGASSQDNLFMFEPYFEVVVGITNRKDKKHDSKPMRAVKYFRDIGDVKQVENDHPKVIEPINHIMDGLTLSAKERSG
ncbi:MAG: AAA family ATPase [Bacteroidetes bacterium]|nr:AAA family ATPase [Bacteroidota bacterium]